MNKNDRALERVQSLYVLQMKILDLLEHDLRRCPRLRKEARTNVREFNSLLRGADWRYMGGEDVLESLKKLPQEVESKLRPHRRTADVRKVGRKTRK